MDDEAVLLVANYGRGQAIVPLLRRPVGNTGVVDLCSPYGYGGPYFIGEPSFSSAMRGVREYAEDSGAACAFIRVDPITRAISDDVEAGIVVAHSANNVIVDLSRPLDLQWRHFAHKVRKNVNKARRAGCKVIIDPDLRQIDEFSQVYLSTMRRREATPWFYFDKRFFRELVDELGASATAFLALDSSGVVVSVELVLESESCLYSFLGGTLSSAFSIAPNDLLKYEIIRYGAMTGREAYVLGGGRQAGDGIYRYKLAFDPEGAVPFYTARLVGDSCALSRAAGGAVPGSLGSWLAADYFPPYRRVPTVVSAAHKGVPPIGFLG